MPMYEFECRTCGNRFTENFSMSRLGQGVRCPKCNGADTVQRIEAAYVTTAKKS